MDLKQIRTGDILLVQGFTTQAKLIQGFQIKDHIPSGAYNHSGILEVSRFHIWVNEETQVPNGRKGHRPFKAASVPTHLDHYLKGNYNLLLLQPFAPIHEDTMEAIIRNNLGIPYDYWLLLHDKPMQIQLKKFLGRKKGTEKRMVCHEFTMECWNDYAEFYGWDVMFPSSYQANVKDMFEHSFFNHITLKSNG